MARKKLTSNMRTRLRKKAKVLSDELGDLKEDKRLVCERITDITEELKDILKKVGDSESIGRYYRSLYDEYEKKSTDWKSLAMSYKPSKVRIKKYTTTEDVERLRTYEVD